jgi:phospholipid/cholesterol/gamma-HCH transport system permease protein
VSTAPVDSVVPAIPGVLRWLEDFGRFCRFAIASAAACFGCAVNRRYWRLLVPQFYEVGCRSVPVILITGAFVGMVLAVQSVDQFRSAGIEDRMGVVINVSVVRELGPVLAAVMIAGRIGGALTAELGTMNVTEQIDALRVMGADPIRHLVGPRVLACLLLAPFLTLYCDLMGVMGGSFIAININKVESGPYWYFSANALEWFDLFTGAVKAIVFGGLIGLVSCYKGFHCRAGAEGVGRACTEAFVIGFIFILVLDFFLAYLLQTIYQLVWGFKPLF